jgi:hypothetical protein
MWADSGGQGRWRTSSASCWSTLLCPLLARLQRPHPLAPADATSTTASAVPPFIEATTSSSRGSVLAGERGGPQRPRPLAPAAATSTTASAASPFTEATTSSSHESSWRAGEAAASASLPAPGAVLPSTVVGLARRAHKATIHDFNVATGIDHRWR